mgnify:CR=1 FL=1|tara:strand:- start:35 stop:571 length:537 start_codon:yes stop_codon:yes gene_type:complete
MSSGNLSSVVLILFIFSLIHLYLTLSIGIADIEKNWDKYKCNPGIIPFAGIFGKDPLVTSKECIKLTQVNFMSSFLEPIYASIGFLAENGDFFSDIFSNMKIFGNGLQNENINMWESVGQWFQGISLQLTQTFINFIEIFGSANNTINTLGLGLTQGGYILTSSLTELPGLIFRMAAS